MARFIIIGNGVAANSAAESIRKKDTDSEIVMFTRQKHYFYYTPALLEYLAGEKDVEGFTVHNRQWYETSNIDLRLKTEITDINPADKTVNTHDGTRFSYDRLLLATGGYSFVPPIEGADSEGVFTLRTVEDADAIKQWASSSKRLVLIGGGLLGLEAGNGLRRAGLDVSVVEFFPRLLPRQMDVDGAAILQRQMEEMGFAFHLGAKTKSISRDGKELSVNLENGESLAADMVLISAGVRPELGLAKMIGLDIDKAVKVDDRMQTNVQDIFAAGDVSEHRGAYYGIWPPAMQQGQTAGANMAGEDRAYTGTVPANTLKVVGIDLTSAGNIDADSERESAVIADSDKYIYRKIVFNNGLIEGAILLGDIRGSAEILMAMQSQKDVSSLKDDMKREDFDFSRLK